MDVRCHPRPYSLGPGNESAGLCLSGPVGRLRWRWGLEISVATFSTTLSWGVEGQGCMKELGGAGSEAASVFMVPRRACCSEALQLLLAGFVWEQHLCSVADFLGVQEAVGVVKAQDICKDREGTESISPAHASWWCWERVDQAHG